MIEDKIFFELISKLTTTEKTNNEIDNIYDEIYLIINKKINPLLGKLWDDDKWKWKDTLDSILSEMNLFTRYPFVFNKNCIGILDSRNKTINDFLFSITEEKGYLAYIQQRIIPTIIYNNEVKNKIIVTNNEENTVELNVQELKYFLTLNKRLRFNQIAKSCAITTKLVSNNLCFINLPQYNVINFKDSEFINLAKICSAYILICENEDDYDKIPFCIKKSSSPVYIFSNCRSAERIEDSLREKCKNRVINIYNLDNISSLKFDFNDEICNYYFMDELQFVFLNIYSNIHNMMNELIEKRRLFNRENYYFDSVQDNNIIKGLIKSNEDNISLLSNIENNLKVAEKTIFEKIEEFNKLLKEQYVLQNTYNNINDVDDLKIKIILLAIENKNFTIAKKYINEISYDYKYRYILDLYLAEETDILNDYGNLSFDFNLTRLKKEDNNNFVIRAKLRFAQKLNLNRNEILELINNLTDELTAKEHYLKGEYYNNIDGNASKRAILEYQKAFDMGNKDAGDILADYYNETEQLMRLKGLADRHSAKAALLYSDYRFSINKRPSAMCYLKIAAGLQYIPAIYKYANLIYKNVNYKNRENVKDILPIYLYIYKRKNNMEWKNFLIPDIAAKIGSMYYYEGDYIQAKNFLEKDSNTEISNYFLGMMYFNSYGVRKDLDKAETYFKQAIKLGSERAVKKLDIVKNQLEKEKRKQDKYYKGDDYSSSYEHVSTSSELCIPDPCFITTAVCKSLNKPDDCEELTLLRNYREEILSKTLEGKILINEYYQIAPIIISYIEQEKESANIYYDIYSNCISPIYKLLLKKDYSTALLNYCELVKNLADKYNLTISDTTYKILQRLKN